MKPRAGVPEDRASSRTTPNYGSATRPARCRSANTPRLITHNGALRTGQGRASTAAADAEFGVEVVEPRTGVGLSAIRIGDLGPCRLPVPDRGCKPALHLGARSRRW